MAHPLAGKPAPHEQLVDVQRLLKAYFEKPDPKDPALEFFVQAGSRTMEFRGKRPDLNLGRSCVLTLDCAGTLGGWTAIDSTHEYTRVDLVRHDFEPHEKRVVDPTPLLAGVQSLGSEPSPAPS